MGGSAHRATKRWISIGSVMADNAFKLKGYSAFSWSLASKNKTFNSLCLPQKWRFLKDFEWTLESGVGERAHREGEPSFGSHLRTASIRPIMPVSSFDGDGRGGYFPN